MQSKSLGGKVALVTGSSRGIGSAIATRLAQMGAKVVINYLHNEEAARNVVETIQSQDLFCASYRADVSRQEEVEQLFGHVTENVGPVEVLINNAGITRDNLLLRMSETDWDDVITTNLKSAFMCTKAALRGMLKARWGRIVNISSVVALGGNPGQANYTAAKAGLIALTKSTAREVASRGITVNALAPGFIETAMTESLDPKLKEQILSGIPLARFGSAEDVAGAAAFLCSPDGSYITGHVLTVDGGLSMV